MDYTLNLISRSAQVPPVALEIYSAPGAANGQPWNMPTTLLLILVSLAITTLLVWTAWTRILDTIHVLRRGASARDLFLKMRIKYRSSASSNDPESQSSKGVDAYLRYVDRHEADVVCTVKPTKGQRVTLLLGSLPGFPTKDLTVEAKVIKVRPIGGTPEKYLVVTRFGHLDEVAEQPLLSYIHSLIRPVRVYS